jgi:hypothetical protein
LRHWTDLPRWLVILIAFSLGLLISRLTKSWWDRLGLRLNFRPYDEGDKADSDLSAGPINMHRLRDAF